MRPRTRQGSVPSNQPSVVTAANIAGVRMAQRLSGAVGEGYGGHVLASAGLRGAERTERPDEVTRRPGISRGTFYRWRKQFGGLQVGDARRLKALEEENRRLKRVVADQALNAAALKGVLGREW